MRHVLIFILVNLVFSFQVLAASKDTIPPGNIDDLTAFNGRKIEIEWTAAGDDGTVGRVRYYEIRYTEDKSFDLEKRWDEAKILKKVRGRKKSGIIEKIKVRKLKPDVTCYYALGAFDETGNMSGVSNVTNSGKDIKKADIYMKRANKLFYARKKKYKPAVKLYLKALQSGARVKNVDSLFKVAFCYKKLKNKKSQYYFDRHLENQHYYFMIKDDPYSSKGFNLEKYNDFMAGISFLGTAFTEPKKKNETVMYVPDKWVQKYRKQGTYLFLFYLVDYAFCYGDFPGYFTDLLKRELEAVENGTSKLSAAYVYAAIAAHHMFNGRYEEALEYYKLAESIEDNEEDYANSLKELIEKVEKLVK